MVAAIRLQQLQAFPIKYLGMYLKCRQTNYRRVEKSSFQRSPGTAIPLTRTLQMDWECESYKGLGLCESAR